MSSRSASVMPDNFVVHASKSSSALEEMRSMFLFEIIDLSGNKCRQELKWLQEFLNYFFSTLLFGNIIYLNNLIVFGHLTLVGLQKVKQFSTDLCARECFCSNIAQSIFKISKDHQGCQHMASPWTPRLNCSSTLRNGHSDLVFDSCKASMPQEHPLYTIPFNKVVRFICIFYSSRLKKEECRQIYEENQAP